MNNIIATTTGGLGAASLHRISVSDESLNFRPVTVADPVPLGRQILIAAGLTPVDDFSLFAVLPSGDFEDIRLDETFDLRAKGTEHFVAFRSDRDFRLTLNDHELRWGKPAISGATLRTLAKAADDQVVYLEVRGGEDRLVEPGELIDLTKPGVERFFTAPRPTFEIIVNARQKTVAGPEVTFSQIVQLAFPGPHEPNVVFSMSFRHAASKPPAGELGAGGVVKVKKGTVFNVTRTTQS
ncbi:MAG: multiubiquitin domain-containing protein [Planctomycetes bacterium]|nr:multiubiquitin domain-containing protein [Planctomycetota bacterium]